MIALFPTALLLACLTQPADGVDSELSAFDRAFKRWTDSTRLDYRREVADKLENRDGTR